MIEYFAKTINYDENRIFYNHKIIVIDANRIIIDANRIVIDAGRINCYAEIIISFANSINILYKSEMITRLYIQINQLPFLHILFLDTFQEVEITDGV